MSKFTAAQRVRNARHWARHPVAMTRYATRPGSTWLAPESALRDRLDSCAASARYARYGPAATRWSNWRNRRALERGRAPRADGVAAAVTSRTPVVRDRINPATGRPRRDDAMMHRSRNEGLARMKGRPAPVRQGRGTQ